VFVSSTFKDMVAGYHSSLLEAMGRSGEEIGRTLADLGRRYGMDITGAGGKKY
jgi:hypothetical protein